MSKKCIALILLAFCLSLTACAEQQIRDSHSSAQGDYSTLLDKPKKEQAPASTLEPSSGPVAIYEISRQSAVVWKDSIGTTWVQVIVEVENTGTLPLYLDSGSADLETGDGTLVKVIKSLSGFPQVLLPGERGVFYDATTLDEEQNSELSVVPHFRPNEATVPVTRLKTSDITLSEGKYGGFKLMGRVENPGPEPIDGVVYIVGICYNSDGDCIAVVFTLDTEGFVAGERRGFEASEMSLPKTMTPEDVAAVEVYAYLYQLQL